MKFQNHEAKIYEIRQIIILPAFVQKYFSEILPAIEDTTHLSCQTQTQIPSHVKAAVTLVGQPKAHTIFVCSQFM
jgi:hypothetical protein